MIIISERGVKGKSNKQTKARQNSKGAGVMHKSSEQGVTQSHTEAHLWKLGHMLGTNSYGQGIIKLSA